MKKILLLGLCAIAMFSCKKDNTLFGMHVYGTIKFYVQNDSGANLVSPKTQGYWSVDDFKFYYLNQAQEKVLYYNSMMDAYNGFSIGPAPDYANIPGDRLVINVALHNEQSGTNPNERYGTNYIEWPNGEMDKIESKHRIEPGFLSLIEVKINGQLMWTARSYSNLDKDGNYALFNKVITDNGSKITLFTDYEYKPQLY